MNKKENNYEPKNRIKQLRLEQRKTQKEVGDAIGKSDRAIAHYERGIREPKLETWIKLAEFFDVSVSYLQGTSDVRRSSIDKTKVDDLKRSGQRAIWLERDAKKLLKNYSSVSAESLTYQQLKTLTALSSRFNSLVGSLVEYNSYKSLEALKNVVTTLGIITAQYRVLYDEPEKFEKEIMPVINGFLVELKRKE